MVRRPPPRALSFADVIRRSGSSKESAHAVPHIEGVAFSAATIRSGGIAVATLRGRNLDGAPVRCDPVGRGFIIDVLPHHTVQAEGEQLVLAMRVYRRIGNPRSLCLVRVSVGSSSAVGSITVGI